ncbi:MAG: hypothetical protein PHW15_03500 [Patescibacteria group bacterium]|nr:hypothetical protein [Patescibacteria group bacterium]
MKTKVENMTSKNGNSIPNQFIITDENGNEFFQSYDSIIAVKRPSGKIELDEKYWDYSTTTGKYRNIFLHETKDITEMKIKSGVYILTDLN